MVIRLAKIKIPAFRAIPNAFSPKLKQQRAAAEQQSSANSAKPLANGRSTNTPFAEATRAATQPSSNRTRNMSKPRLEATETLTVSVSDGKIGSFFLDGARLRTTHKDGPLLDKEQQRKDSSKFEVDETLMFEAFQLACPKVSESQKQWLKRNSPNLSGNDLAKQMWQNLRTQVHNWAADQLRDQYSEKTPFIWATPVWKDALTPMQEDAADDSALRLMEVGFTEDRKCYRHISRGVLRELKVSKQELAALKKLRDEVPTHENPDDNPHLKNLEFYKKMSKLAPRLAAMITPPAEFFKSERVDL